MLNKIKKYLTIGTLALAGAVSYSGQKFGVDSFKGNDVDYIANAPQCVKVVSKNYIDNVVKSTPFEEAKKKYDEYKKSELERVLEKERKIDEKIRKEKLLNPYFLSQDSLTKVIEKAYSEMKAEGKRWPAEFDKKLFRLMLRQESGYNINAISPAGYRGLGQIGYGIVETLRPKEWEEEFKNPETGKLDTLKVNEYMHDPVNNVRLSLEGLTFFSNYCRKNIDEWKDLDVDSKRRIILSCYNAGNGTMKKVGFDYNSRKLSRETRSHHEKIMDAYYSSK